MKYYSEATVNGIIHDMYQGYDIPKATDYPSIEIPDKHGRLIEADEVDEAISESLRNGEITGGSAGLFTAIVHNASTIVPSTVH